MANNKEEIQQQVVDQTDLQIWNYACDQIRKHIWNQIYVQVNIPIWIRVGSLIKSEMNEKE